LFLWAECGRPNIELGCQLEWEIGEGDCSTAVGGSGYQFRQVDGGEAQGAALGQHGDVVNSIHGQWGGVAHRGGCSMVVGGRPQGIGVEEVAGGRWRSGVGAGRRTGAGWHCRGPWQRRRSSGSTLRRLCFDDNGAGLGLEGGGGTRGTAARVLKAQPHSQVHGG
jgi:hypothetical protein